MASPGMGHVATGGDHAGGDEVPAGGVTGFALYNQALIILGDSKQREEVRLKAAQDLNEGLDAAIALSSSQEHHPGPGTFLHQVGSVCKVRHLGSSSRYAAS